MYLHGYTTDDHDVVHWIFTLYLCAFLTSILGLAGHLSNLFVDALLDFSHYLKVSVFTVSTRRGRQEGRKTKEGNLAPK